MARTIFTAACALIAAALTVWAAALRAQPPAPEARQTWRTFHGNWSATGRRQTIGVEDGRLATVVQLSGAVLLITDAGSRTGFQGEAIGFDDGSGFGTGRAVWTDAKGHRLFSVLRGEAIRTGRRTVGTITGGTGPYDGAIGEFELTWQYVVSAEDNAVQGRTVDLRGRYRQRNR